MSEYDETEEEGIDEATVVHNLLIEISSFFDSLPLEGKEAKAAAKLQGKIEMTLELIAAGDEEDEDEDEDEDGDDDED